MKDKAYGHNEQAVGRSKSLNKHPGTNKKDQEHFSEMAKVDAKEMHTKSIKNMSAVPSHVKSMPISDRHSYKRQSHAVKPAKIESFVGNRLDTHPGQEPQVKKPDSDMDYDND